MAIIKCPECGQDISDQAGKCVHCGYPLKRSKQPSTKGTHNKVFLFIAIPLLVVAVVFLVLGIMANNSQTRKCFFNNAQFTELHNTLDGTVRKNTTDGSTTISFEKYQCSYGDDLTAVIIFNNGSSQQKVLYRLQSGKINEITMDYMLVLPSKHSARKAGNEPNFASAALQRNYQCESILYQRRSVYRPRYKCKNAKQAVGIYADDN